ncbi:MAG TPA: universal stress protein [Chitinophagaceae bacterium]|nr:universal stress protein [Chitinophagaceae bacterium]
MNKIIAAIDGLKFSESTVSYAIEFAKQANAHLVGVFLDDFTYHSYKIYELVTNEGVSERKLKILEEKDVDTRQVSVEFFEEICRKDGVNYSIHHDRNVAIRELLHESIYADLLVIDRKETLTHYDEKVPTRFIRDLLSNVQSPVIVVPEKYKPIEKIILLYDGEPSSVHAIKMFNFLFPSLQAKTEVLSIKERKDSLHLPDNRLMKEFMNRHYPDAEYTVLKGNAEEEIVQYTRHLKQNAMIVLGAYQRGMVSRWFHESMADVLMKELNCPLFIAHNK